MIKRKFLKLFGRRRLFLGMPLMLLAGGALVLCYWLAGLVEQALILPPPLTQNLGHFWKNKSLSHYLSKTQLLVEPSSTPCEELEVPIVVMVTSAPGRFAQRQAIRSTWASYQPTYFLLGVTEDDELVNTYLEAKEFSDMVIFDFTDDYQNLTLKTALMMQWTLDRCPHTGFMMKTDDDVLINPWRLREVLEAHNNDKLIGSKQTQVFLHRDSYSKWFIPRWLLRQDRVSEYLSGTGYIIHGDYLHKIFTAATLVPLINLEDVYFTYLVAKRRLHYPLTHDPRFASNFRHWPVDCAWWNLTLVHSLEPADIVVAWKTVVRLEETYKKYGGVCNMYSWMKSWSL